MAVTAPRRTPAKRVGRKVVAPPAIPTVPLQPSFRPDTTVLFVSPEIPPWIKAGGLGDVTSALPAALRRAGIDVRVLVPAYSPVLAGISGDLRVVAEYAAPGGAYPPARVLSLGEVNGAPLYAVDCPPLFARDGGPYIDAAGTDWADTHIRFGLLCKVAALIARDGLTDGFRPTIMHCNDWPAGLVPGYLRWMGVTGVGSVITLHNVAHQGIFSPDALPALDIPSDAFQINGVEYNGNASFLKAGIFYADRITTVSPRYAMEIQTPEGGLGLGGLLLARSGDVVGILNGIDTELWNPRHDHFLARTYDEASLDGKRANKRALQERLGLALSDTLPLIGVISRLAHQKGLDLLVEIALQVIALPAQIALLGAGEKSLESAFQGLAERHPESVGVKLGFDERLAHLIEAGADMFAMPSRFEPCGLNQMYSLRYGTPPIVRSTGGLFDTVTDFSDVSSASGEATGFVFDDATGPALFTAIERAVTTWKNRTIWRALQQNGMRRNLGWDRSAERYADTYEALVGATRPSPI
ncbi:MAG: glycogen synthase GlgA [Burkholderiales bacterium]